MQVILTRSHSVASLLIRARLSLHRGERERHSHALVQVSDSDVIDATFQAGGVRRRPLAKALHRVSDGRRLRFLLPDEAAAQAWLAEQLGKDYDWRGCWGWATADRDWQDDCAWFCFELIAGALRAGGLDVFADLSRVTAGDLERLAARLQVQRVAERAAASPAAARGRARA